ncbi:hypothetical protein NMG60_11001179 [Bertholletia excelsa]
MGMDRKAFLPLLLFLFLGFSFIISSAAVPTSRRLKSLNDAPSVQDLLAQGEMDHMRKDGELAEAEELMIEGRMDLQSNDYPGTGANNHHDPKSPGRV